MIDFAGIFNVLYSIFFSLYNFVKPVFDFLSSGIEFAWQGQTVSLTAQELLFGGGVGILLAVSIFKWIPLIPD